MNEVQKTESEVKTFIYGDADVRIVEIDNEPWFVGKDVAEVLGYGKGSSLANAVANHVEAEDKGVTKMMTPGGMQDVTVINESGLYSLIFGSKLESAKRFKRWVTSEVLPQIRKTGGYQSPAVLNAIDERLSRVEATTGMMYEGLSKMAEANAKIAEAVLGFGQNLNTLGHSLLAYNGRAARQMPEWKLSDAQGFADDCIEFVEDASEGAELRVWEVYSAYRRWKEAVRPWSSVMSQGDLTRALKSVFGLQEKQKRYQGIADGDPVLIFLDIRFKQSAAEIYERK